MGKSGSAPSYATTKYDTGGLFGSSTSGASGTSYKPTDSISSAGNSAWSGLNNSLNAINSNDYSNDPNFQAYQNQLNKTAQQAYDANVLSPLANRGLMRSSGLQAATNSFNNTLADNVTDLYDSYYNRQANTLSNNQNVLNNLYSYITGLNSGAMQNTNQVNDYNKWKYQMDMANNQANNALWGQLAGAAAGVAGNALGGPIGGALASKLTKNALTSGTTLA